MTTIRHFGLVTAVISDRDRRVELRYRQPDKRHTGQNLSVAHRKRCLVWCLDALAELREAGYIFDVPEAVPGG